MVSYLKGFFWNRELTDKELYSEYKKSKKTVKDFEKYIMNIKEGKETVALKEIHGIEISDFKEIDELIEILEKNNVNRGITLSTNRDKKKLNGVYNQLKSISYIHKNFLKEDEMLKNFIYSNKFDLFTYLRKKYEKGKNESFLNFIFDTYFNPQNYLNALEYFLYKDSKNDIQFLLPNNTNYIQIQIKNAIPIYINLSDIFYNLNENDENNKINNLLLNIIIYFYTNHKEDQTSKNLDKYIPSKKAEHIEIVISLYNLAKKVDSDLTLKNFTENQNLLKVFKKISSVDYDIFSTVFTNIMANVKVYSNIYKGLKFLPLEIIRDMIVSRAKYDFITKGIDIIINSNEYNNAAIFNFVLKYLFDYYCFNKISLTTLSKIINYLSKYNSHFNQITNQLDSLLEIIEIFEKENTKFILKDLVNDDIKDISKNNKYIIALIDYLNILFEKSIQYNNNKYNFIDQYIMQLNILISYKKGLSYGKLLLYYFDIYEDKRHLILNVIDSNKNIILNQNEIQSLVDLYLLKPYLIKAESEQFIEEFLNDSNRMKLSIDTTVKLDHLLEYLKIKLYIQKYNINDSSFKNYSLDNYMENIPEIMKLLLIKTTNLDNITNIQTFLNSQQSKDIQNSLRLEQNKYEFYLFNILIEFDKITLANEVLDLLFKNEDKKYFNKSIDFIYNNYCKKNKEKFKNFCKSANIEEYLIENSNKYLDILIDNNDFSKEEKISFPLKKQPNDILLLYSLIKNKKIKKEQNKSCNDLFISFDKYNNDNPPKNKNLKHLIDYYYKYKEEDDSNNNRHNYNYSLHPKLIELLKTNNYLYLFQDLKITFEVKIKIYNFCIKNKLCTLNDIINNYETIKLLKKTKNDKEIIEKYKLLFNLYEENDENNNNIYKELYNFTKNNYDSEQNKKNWLLLIDFNLSNKLFISYNNLLFLNIFFDYPIKSSDEQELKLLKILYTSNTKVNILPFCSDFNQIFLNDKNYQDIMEKYYKNNLIISLKENNLYFEDIKTKNISSNPSIYFKSLELFKILNLGNFFNLRNIFEYLNKNYKEKININFLFALKMIMNFLSISCCILHRTNYGLNNLIGIFNSLNFKVKDINKLLKETFYFQSISYINNSCHNILLYNEKTQILIKNFMQSKQELIERLVQIYYGSKISDSMIFSEHKIFLVKNAIINKMNDNNILNMYNAIKSLNDYKDIIEEIKDNKKLQDEIYDIYSDLNN